MHDLILQKALDMNFISEHVIQCLLFEVICQFLIRQFTVNKNIRKKETFKGKIFPLKNCIVLKYSLSEERWEDFRSGIRNFLKSYSFKWKRNQVSQFFNYSWIPNERHLPALEPKKCKPLLAMEHYPGPPHLMLITVLTEMFSKL